MKYKDISFKEIKTLSHQVCLEIQQSNTVFDCIIGIAKGGNIPATLISYELEVPTFKTIQIKSYNDDNERKATVFSSGTLSLIDELNKYNNVLLVDDLADSGKTLSEFHELYKFLSNKVKVPNIKTACLYYKTKSEFKPDYYASSIEGADVWLNFPWE